jgi:hypothetical protein
MDNSQTIEVFGWKPIPFEKTIIDMGTSVQNIMTEKRKGKK